MATIVKWHGDSSFDQEVVGESRYQSELRAFSGGERRTVTTARLVCESNNPYDKLAVHVEIEGKTIGYLSRDEARAHRKLLSASKLNGAIVELPAAIATGREGIMSVWLDVAESDVRSMLGAKPRPTGMRLTDRVLIGLVIVLACVGVTLMVVGFGSAGSGSVQPTPTMGKLSDFLTRVP